MKKNRTSTQDAIDSLNPMPGVSTRPIMSAYDHWVTGLVDGKKGVIRRMYRVSIKGYLTEYAYRKVTGDPGSWVTIETDFRSTPQAAASEWNKLISRICKAAGRGEEAK